MFGVGDAVRVLFDVDTDAAGGARSGDKAYVDSLFSFSLPLGLSYFGSWDDPRTFSVTILNTLNAWAVHEKLNVGAPVLCLCFGPQEFQDHRNKMVRDGNP